MSAANTMTQVERILEQLPDDIRSSLSDGQRGALMEALQAVGWKRDHAVNIRLSAPLGYWRFFVTLIAGAEKRAPQRVTEERRSHPVRTLGNFLFLGALAVAIYLVALAGVLAYSSIIEF